MLLSEKLNFLLKNVYIGFISEIYSWGLENVCASIPSCFQDENAANFRALVLLCAVRPQIGYDLNELPRCTVQTLFPLGLLVDLMRLQHADCGASETRGYWMENRQNGTLVIIIKSSLYREHPTHCLFYES